MPAPKTSMARPPSGNPVVVSRGPEFGVLDEVISVAAGATVTLDGTGSSDADGDPLSFRGSHFSSFISVRAQVERKLSSVY